MTGKELYESKHKAPPWESLTPAQQAEWEKTVLSNALPNTPPDTGALPDTPPDPGALPNTPPDPG